MDPLIDYEQLYRWIESYGSFSLFILLAMGIVALPVPEETLMILTGILMSKGHLAIPSAIIATLAGSMCGITMSYLIGRTAGYYFVHRFGSWLGITEKKLQKAHTWFEKFGKWTLLVGYFIPGVRHFTGLIAGTTALEYKVFALFAYVGAVLWVSTFLSIGYFLGDYWIAILQKLEVVDFDLVLIALVAITLFIIIFKLKKQTES